MSGSISFDEIESRQGFLATGAKPETIDYDTLIKSWPATPPKK